MNNQLDERQMRKIIEIATVVGLGVGTGLGVSYLLSRKRLNSRQDQIVSYSFDNEKLTEIIENRDDIFAQLMMKTIREHLDPADDYNEQKIHLVYKYALKDFAEIILNAKHKGNAYKNDLFFVQAMAKLLCEKDVTDKDIKEIINRIKLRYSALVEGDVEPDFDSILRQLKNDNMEIVN